MRGGGEQLVNIIKTHNLPGHLQGQTHRAGPAEPCIHCGGVGGGANCAVTAHSKRIKSTKPHNAECIMFLNKDSKQPADVAH